MEDHCEGYGAFLPNEDTNINDNEMSMQPNEDTESNCQSCFRNIKGCMYGLLAGAVVSIADLIIISTTTKEQVLLMLLIRNVIILFLSSFILILTKRKLVVERHLWFNVTAAALLWPLGNIFYNFGLLYLTLFLVLIIERMKSVVSLIFARIIYKTPICVSDIYVLILVTVGVGLAGFGTSINAFNEGISSSNNFHKIGLLFMLGTVILQGFSGVFCMKLSEVDALVITFWQMVYGVAFSAIGSLIMWNIPHFTFEMFLSYLFFALTVLLYMFFLNKGLQVSSAAVIYMAEMSSFPVGLLLQIIVLGIYPNYFSIAGCIIVIFGLTMLLCKNKLMPCCHKSY